MRGLFRSEIKAYHWQEIEAQISNVCTHGNTGQNSPLLRTDVTVMQATAIMYIPYLSSNSALKEERDHMRAFKVMVFTVYTNSLAIAVLITIKEVDRPIRTKKAA